MKTLFILNGLVVGVGASRADNVIISSEIDGTVALDVDGNSPVTVGWHYAVVDDVPVFTAPITVAPTVTPIHFKMLWTSQERVAIKTLRATDAIVDDFMGLVNDPQLTEVVMALESVQNAIWYTLAGLAAAQVIAPEDIAVRHAAISSGVLQ